MDTREAGSVEETDETDGADSEGAGRDPDGATGHEVNGHRVKSLGQANPYISDTDRRCTKCGLTTRGSIDPFRETPCEDDAGGSQ